MTNKNEHVPSPMELNLRLTKLENPQKANVGDSVSFTNWYAGSVTQEGRGVVVKVEDMAIGTYQSPLFGERPIITPRKYWVWDSRGKLLFEVPEHSIIQLWH